jgi:hypothetical protein
MELTCQWGGAGDRGVCGASLKKGAALAVDPGLPPMEALCSPCLAALWVDRDRPRSPASIGVPWGREGPGL